MPHSSGGGFHGGGFHGGSGFHTGSSSSYKPGGISKISYTGAHRFYYYRHNRANYVYSDIDISTSEYRSKQAKISALMIIMPIIILAIVTYLTFLPPRKLDYSKIKGSTILIEDTVDILKDYEEEKLHDTLEDFYYKTGIPVAIVTIDKAEWTGIVDLNKPMTAEERNYWLSRKRYVTLGQYAHAKYLDMFSDEGHWLIVYAVEENGFRWEGMQGDDTDSILTEGKTKKFGEALHDLFENSDYTPGEALITQFNTFNQTVMTPNFNENLIGIFVEVIVFAMGFMIWGIIRLVNNKTYFIAEDEDYNENK